MNGKLQLKLQACLDGELPPREAGKLLHSLGIDPEALALQDELKLTKSLLRGNELEVKLSESREFYWSKICREIERDDRRKRSGAPQRLTWLRWFVPVGGVCLLTILLAVSVKIASSLPQKLVFSQEIETPLEDMSLISFRSESEGFSVVWVNTR